MAENLNKVLSHDTLLPRWQLVLQQWQGVSEADKQASLARIAQRRELFSAVLSNLETPADQESCFVLMYVLARSEWILLNSQNLPEEHSVARYSALLATLLGTMELAMPTARVAQVTELLLRVAEPFDTETASETEEVEQLRAQCDSLCAALAARDQERELLAREIGVSTPERIIARVVELQNSVAALSMELAQARSQAPTEESAVLSDDSEDLDLTAMLGSLETALRQYN